MTQIRGNYQTNIYSIFTLKFTISSKIFALGVFILRPGWPNPAGGRTARPGYGY